MAQKKKTNGTQGRETVRFQGERLTPSCIEQLRQEARVRGIHYTKIIAAVLEDWCQQGAEPPPPAANGSGKADPVE